MSDINRGSAVFKPRARLLSLLGEQLITNEVIAVVELVKNAWDARANSVTVTLENAADPENGRIVVEDDGTGMTLDTILNVWLEPGTEYRKNQRTELQESGVEYRPILGEKGIGRFAAHRLGNVIEVITKDKDSEVEVLVEVNWRMFDQNKSLADVPVYWMTRKPKVFTENKHGTKLIISDLKTAWNQGMAENLAEKLDALQAPLLEKYGFSIKVTAPEFFDIEKKEMPLKEIFKTAIYSFKGFVSENGFLEGTYQFSENAFPSECREKLVSEDVRPKSFVLKKGELRKPCCGPFTIRLYVWDLDLATLRETVKRGFYVRTIKPHTGVRIHRDGFRVWPYGELGNDWLNLDSRRVNNPTKCISNNQVIGIVNISGQDNPGLVDKTDREGIIASQAFEDFKDIVLSAISTFEVERRNDRDKIAHLTQGKKKRFDLTVEAIKELTEEMKKNSDLAIYEKDIAKIEDAYTREVKEVIEPLIVSAGVGIAYLMPAHEIHISITALEKQIKSLESELVRIGVGGQIADAIPNILGTIKMIREVAEGALKLTSKKTETFSLKSAVEFACYIKQPSMQLEGVNWAIDQKDKYSLTIRGQKNLVTACVLNVLDNSIYWLSHTQDKKIRITIDHDSNLRPRVVVSDNGPGIRREDVPYLGEAFWTRKPEGTGLGLFISKRAMESNRGEVSFGFAGEEPEFMSGANVILTFAQDMEIKGD